jgi:UDP-N-acetylglucosamine 2-epimerase
MRDALEMHLERAAGRPHPAAARGLAPHGYVLATVHRADDGLAALPAPVLFPVHPRTRKALAAHGLAARLIAGGRIHAVDPVGYLDMLVLERDARVIVTDSGGIQKEAYLLGTPCLTVFAETAWPETVAAGWNRLVPPEGAAIRAAVAAAAALVPERPRPDLYGDGRAAERIAELLATALEGDAFNPGPTARGAS